MKKRAVRIFLNDAGYGLSRDGRVLRDLMTTAGIDVRTADILKRRRRLARVDINIFLEFIEPEWLSTASTNLFIPNPDWLQPATRQYVCAVDCVLCKTRHSQAIFQNMGCPTRFTSFTTPSRFARGYRRNPRGCLHVAGNSLQKGTAVLVECWLRHPRWPVLHVVKREGLPLLRPAANVKIYSDYLPDTMLCNLLNAHGIHLCPSETEGFGHTIVEGMSVGAVVLTTDAPPMNELVQPDRGLLVEARAVGAQMAATRYRADTDSLCKGINQLLMASDQELQCLGEAAMSWFEENDRFFRCTFMDMISEV